MIDIEIENHPVMVGKRYRRVRDGVKGILDYAKYIPRKNEMDIHIRQSDDYCVYEMNWSTFAFDWELCN